MAEFFDKLRKDREQVESRSLCNDVTNENAKDALRIQLSLYYAGLPNGENIAKAIVDSCLRSAAVVT